MARGFAENEFADLVDLVGHAVLDDPIVAGEAGIEITERDVTADLLRADEPDLEVGIVDVRFVAAAGDGDVPARLGEFLQGGVLQTALGQPEPELARRGSIAGGNGRAAVSAFAEDFLLIVEPAGGGFCDAGDGS